MTILCAMIYSDPKSDGFILGADSYASIRKNGQEIQNCMMDKTFYNDEIIGLLSGTFVLNESNPFENYQNSINELSDIFRDIESKKDYSHVDFLSKSDNYKLIIGRRNKDTLDLFTISSQRKHVASRLKRINQKRRIIKNLAWYAPHSTQYIVLGFDKKTHAKESLDIVSKFLTFNTDTAKEILDVKKDYSPGQPTIYRLSFDGIERCKANI